MTTSRAWDVLSVKQFTRYVYVEMVSPRRFRVRGGCACVSSRGRVPFGTFTPASHVRTQAMSSSFLPGVDDTGGQADGESPEGHGEDREAEDEPDVHAAERGLLVLGPLRLVVLLRLLDSALPALLHRASWHRRRPVGDAVPRRWGHGEGSCGSRDRSGGERGTCSRPHSRHGPRG